MESARAITLYFCEHCGSLRLRDVKDQLQKLFTETSTKPNVCGICQQGVDQIETSAQSQYEGVSNNIVIKTETGILRSLLSTADVGNSLNESSQASGNMVRSTRLSTGVIATKLYANASSKVGCDDDDDDDYQVSDEHDDDDESVGNYSTDDSDSCNMDVNSTANDPISDQKQDDKLITIELMPEDIKVDKPVCGTVGVAPELLQLMKPTDDPMRPFKCKFCDALPFKKLLPFQKHIRDHIGKDPVKRPYKCEVCAQRFYRPGHLFKHQVMHTRLKCSQEGCKFTFTNKNDLKCHLQVHSGDMPLQCETCGLGFKWKSSLNVHQSTHSDARPFSCKYCDKTFSHIRYHKSHQKTHVNTDKYKCDSCVYTCQKESTLMEHKRTHKQKGAFKCERCQHLFKYKTLFVRHTKINKCKPPKPITTSKPSSVPEADIDISDLSDITRWLDLRVVAMMGKPPSIDVPFKCKYCDSKEWQSPQYLVKHVRDFHPHEPVITKPYVCDACDKRYKCESNLKLHYLNHKWERPFRCDHSGCDKTFTTKEHLKSHDRYVHDEKQHLCSTCGKKFVNDYKLKKHVARVHLKLKPYECQHCEQAFAAKDKRDVHEHRIHSTERPFICETCGRSYKIKEDLTYHIRTHTGEKPYSCDFCDYRCSRPDYLKKHRRNHTGEKPYQCNHCDMTFSQRTALVVHERKHPTSSVDLYIHSPQKPDEGLATNEVTTCSNLPSSNDEICNATEIIAVDTMNLMHYRPTSLI